MYPEDEVKCPVCGHEKTSQYLPARETDDYYKNAVMICHAEGCEVLFGATWSEDGKVLYTEYYKKTVYRMELNDI